MRAISYRLTFPSNLELGVRNNRKNRMVPHIRNKTNNIGIRTSLASVYLAASYETLSSKWEFSLFFGS